ncbi:MAG TPA: NAD-dependent epimerase/dehydratase family protein [Thermoleophilaceae bacterium]|nr:NAD-dependent epimerase/dehydratase family protein [Thermoleophilaceae bacterium]
MRVVVTGASGNVGTSVVRVLSMHGDVAEIVGVARRLPALQVPKVEWVAADIVHDDLVPLFTGADAVVHLAWAIQPSRDPDKLHAVNVDGSARVFEAVARARVPALVYASSVGAYSPGPKDEPGVDESWPTGGIESSFYSRHKAAVERLLDRLEREHPEIRSVRLRPGLIFTSQSATEQRRYFAGPFVPAFLMNPRFIPVVPDITRLRFQAVHADDVGRAYCLAVVSSDARGAYNVAAEPVLDPDRLAELLHARKLPVPAAVLRGAAAVTWRLRLQPSPEGWVDMALGAPVMDTSRIRRELGWAPRKTSGEALLELLRGMRNGDGTDTPPLTGDGSGPLRIREFLTGIGGRNP